MRRFAVLSLSGMLAACSSVLGIDDLVADRDPDSGAAPDGSSGCSSACGEPGCGACPTTPQITVSLDAGGSYLVDAFEVTNAEYRRWLETAPSVAKQTAECTWNHSFEPGVSSESEFDAGHPCQGWLDRESALLHDDYPVGCVDWCDAVAYCKWAGKQLCAGLDGTPILSTSTSSPHLSPGTSQWHRACTENGLRTYPYGHQFDATKCSHDGTSAHRVGQHAECQGGYPGIYDMSANMAEWEDACMQYNVEPKRQNCFIRGGEWWHEYPASALEGPKIACDAAVEKSRSTHSNGVGIRCCQLP